MRNFILLLFSLTAICSSPRCIAQQSDDFDDPLGIGLLVFTFSEGQSFDLYRLNDDGTVSNYPFTTIVVSQGEMSLRPVASNEKEWKMFVMYEEWDLYHCICYRKMDEQGYYVIEFGDGIQCCISQDIGQFYDWISYLRVVGNSVYRPDPATNQLRKSADEEGISIESKIKKGEHSLRPVQIQGEWIQVNLYEADCEDSKSFASGWIKWRDDGELLIRISYIC